MTFWQAMPQEIMVPKDPYLIKELPTVPPGASLVLPSTEKFRPWPNRSWIRHIENSGAEVRYHHYYRP